MLHIETLPRLPAGARLIIVGDIHGCLNEFNALLDRCKYNPSRGDVLLLLGDLVNKGPDSIGVVRRAIELKARCLLGNHDVSLLGRMADPDILANKAANDQLSELARIFPRDCAAYLRSLPYIYRIPQFNLIAVHAGLNPTLRLEEQNIWEIVHMRSLDPATGQGHEDLRRGLPWAELWKGPEHVVFGHDARTGLQQLPFATGLDTGCCYGKQLTALMYPGGDFVQVRSKYKPTAEERAAAAVHKYGHDAVRAAAMSAVPVESPFGTGSPITWGSPTSSAASPSSIPPDAPASAFRDPAIASAVPSRSITKNNITTTSSSNNNNGELNVEQLIARAMGNISGGAGGAASSTNSNESGNALLKLLQGGGAAAAAAAEQYNLSVPAPASQRSSTNVTPPAEQQQPPVMLNPAPTVEKLSKRQQQKKKKEEQAAAAAAAAAGRADTQPPSPVNVAPSKGAAAVAAAAAASSSSSSSAPPPYSAASSSPENNNSKKDKKKNNGVQDKTATCSRALAVRELCGAALPRKMFESIVLTLLDSNNEPDAVDAVINDSTIREAVWLDVVPGLVARVEEGARGDEMLLLVQDVAAAKPELVKAMERGGMRQKMYSYLAELAAKGAASLPRGLSIGILKDTLISLK